MSKKTICIKNAKFVSWGATKEGDIYIKNGRIDQISANITFPSDITIDAQNKFVIPGVIDDQVHFREPGLTHKADLYTEPRAAVAGGTTSFMEMPNTKPATLTQILLAEKYATAAQKSIANYSFFMGASNDNLDEVLKTNPKDVCGIKIFMGSSTGNMLVDEETVLEALFQKVPMLIATHCEDEATIRNNTATYLAKYGDNIPIEMHPIIRSEKACYLSSSMAIELAKRYNTRLHILHISTADELALFENDKALWEKRITAEVCVHHLFFNSDDYKRLGTHIKCNPAIKDRKHQEALFPALLDNRLDIIATDHAPHLLSEKADVYTNAPSGLPLVQHGLNVMLDFYHQGKISLESIVEKMCHAPAICFNIQDRGFIQEGYFADLVIIDPDKEWTVDRAGLYSKCGWSPFEGHTFKGKVESTIVSGHLAYHLGQFDESKMGERLLFKG